MSFIPSLPAFNTVWQSTKTAAQQWGQQSITPAAQYVQTTWQGGLPPTTNLTLLEKLNQVYIQNLAMELALKAELSRRAGLPHVAAAFELQRQVTLSQFNNAFRTVALNTIAPNPIASLTGQWQLAQALGAELSTKGSKVKEWL